MRYVKCFRDFSGGLSEAAGDNMADNQLQRAKNTAPGDGFGLARAAGVTQVLARLPQTNSQWAAHLCRLTTAEGHSLTLAFGRLESGRENLYSYDAENVAWSELAVNQPARLDGFIWAHKLYWLDGAAIKVYDGTAISELAPTPANGTAATAAELAAWAKVKTAVAVEQRGQRWFYATPDNEIIFSEIGDPARVQPTSIINVNAGGDDRITALREFNNGLLIFLRDSVYYLSGWDFGSGGDIALSRLNVTSGTGFPQSVCGMDNCVVYLGRDNIYRLRVPQNGVLAAAENLSDKRISGALLAEGPPETAWAAVWGGVYYLSLRAAGGQAREYRYYPGLDAFFGEFDHGGLSYSLSGDNQLYLGLERGYIVRFDPASHHYLDPDSGGVRAISLLAVTKGFDVAGAMAREVRLLSVLIAARQYRRESSHVTVRIKTDYTDSQYRLDLLSLDESLIFGEGRYGEALWGWKDTVTKQLPLGRKAARIAFYFSDDSLDEPLLIYGAALRYRPGRVRGQQGGVTRAQVAYDD